MEQKVNNKKGNALGLFFFKFLVQFFGLSLAYGLLYFVCIYYVIFDKKTVKSSLSYVNRRFPKCNIVKQYLHVYLLFVNQGKQLIDRYFFILRPEKFNINLKGYKELKQLVRNSSSGIILLTAHVGNWQIAMSTLKNLNKTVYLVMRPEDNVAVQETLKIDKEKDNIKIISSEQHLSGIVDIIKKLNEGNVVSIMGDRRYEFNAYDVTFLNDKAWFPYGAFSIAAAVKCPIVILLSAKISNYEYIVNVSNVIYPVYDKKSAKQEQIRKWLQQFADVVNEYVEMYPYQCFLFHDVWGDEDKSSN